MRLFLTGQTPLPPAQTERGLETFREPGPCSRVGTSGPRGPQGFPPIPGRSPYLRLWLCCHIYDSLDLIRAVRDHTHGVRAFVGNEDFARPAVLGVSKRDELDLAATA